MWPKHLKPVAWHDDADRVRMKLGLYHKIDEVHDGMVEYRDISIQGPNGECFLSCWELRSKDGRVALEEEPPLIGSRFCFGGVRLEAFVNRHKLQQKAVTCGSTFCGNVPR